MYYSPIGLCAYFASLVGEYGGEIIGSYARSMILYYVIGVSGVLIATVITQVLQYLIKLYDVKIIIISSWY